MRRQYSSWGKQASGQVIGVTDRKPEINHPHWDAMKKLLQALAFSATVLLPLQPLLAAGLCAPATCTSTTCVTTCCDEMAMPGHAHSTQGCHGAQSSNSQSAPTPHSCEAAGAQTFLQSLDAAKVMAATAAPAAFMPSTASAVLQSPLRQPYPALANQRDRHLLLRVFRI